MKLSTLLAFSLISFAYATPDAVKVDRVKAGKSPLKHYTFTKLPRPKKFPKTSRIGIVARPSIFSNKPFGQFLFDTIYPIWISYATGSSNNRLQKQKTSAVAYDTYANWTDAGWLMYLHGYVYKQPSYSVDRVDALADLLLTPVGLPVRSLTPPQILSIRNSTGDNFVIPVRNSKIRPAIKFTGSPLLVAARNISSNRHGDFSAHLHLPTDRHVLSGNQTSKIQTVSWMVHNSSLNQHISRDPQVYLVPHQGLTFVSDVDDILRVARIWRPSFAIMTLLAWDFTPWMNMPDIYKSIAQRLPQAHFHYITICPELFTPLYVNFLERYYPRGSIDMRSMSGLVHPRETSHRVLLETYPQRKFVLVGDTSNVDLMRLYPKLVVDYPNQIQCVLLRNTSATDASDFTVPDLREFQHLKESKYMVFNVPDDLAGIDFGAGGCRNGSTSGPARLTRADFEQMIPSVSTLLHWAKKKLSCFWSGENSDEFCQTIWSGDSAEEAWLQ